MNDNISIRFINTNSQWYKDHWGIEDPLYDKGFLQWLITDLGFAADLVNQDVPYELLKEFRSLLSDSLDILIAGRELPQENLDRFNRYFANSSFIYEVKSKDSKPQLVIHPLNQDWNYIITDIAVLFMKLITEADITRLKRCDNPACRSVFYDSTKNQARKWCCNSCSSLIKVRRHREKLKTDKSGCTPP